MPSGAWPGGAERSPVAKVITPPARREAVAILVKHHEMSERRAYAVISADRTSIRYRSRRPDDQDLRERLKRWHPSAAGSATGGCTFCSGGRGML